MAKALETGNIERKNTRVLLLFSLFFDEAKGLVIGCMREGSSVERLRTYRLSSTPQIGLRYSGKL